MFAKRQTIAIIECRRTVSRPRNTRMTNWTTIYDRWHQPMQRMAANYLQNSFYAEDIVQDVFLALLKKNISPLFMEHAEAYLRTAVYHRCISHLRKKKIILGIDKWAAGQLHDNTTEHSILYRELQQQHFTAIHQLPTREKEIYLLSHFGGYKKEELALLFGNSAKTVKKQLQVSKKKVRRVLALRA